jgi:hypothetical protein
MMLWSAFSMMQAVESKRTRILESLKIGYDDQAAK